MADEPPVLPVADSAAWRAWLGAHYEDPTGVRLTLAKKGTIEPTSLTYDQALDEAANRTSCYGGELPCEGATAVCHRRRMRLVAT